MKVITCFQMNGGMLMIELSHIAYIVPSIVSMGFDNLQIFLYDFTSFKRYIFRVCSK